MWLAAPLGLGTVSSFDESLKEWPFGILEEKVEFGAVMMVIWALWKERNGLVWEGRANNPLN